MTKPHKHPVGSMSWHELRPWRSRCLINDHSRKWNVIMTECRDVLRQCEKVMALDFAQSASINLCIFSGENGGLSEASIANINHTITTINDANRAGNWRHSTAGDKRDHEVNTSTYIKIGEEARTPVCFQIRRGESRALVRYLAGTESAEYQGLPSKGRQGEMETRQRTKEAEEHQRMATEAQKQKGKGLAQDSPSTEIWEIEDESEEEIPLDGEGGWSVPLKRMAAESQHQQCDGFSEPSGKKGRRPGLRNSATTPVEETEGSRKRGWGPRKRVQRESERTGRKPNPEKKTRLTVNYRLKRAERAFLKESNPAVRRVMEFLEEEALQNQSADEMEEWESLLHDPGHTRGRMTLFKQSLHIYWVMKGLLAKALEQVAQEMVKLAKGDPDLRRELSFIRIAMERQEEKMEALHQMLRSMQGADVGGTRQQPDLDTA